MRAFAAALVALLALAGGGWSGAAAAPTTARAVAPVVRAAQVAPAARVARRVADGTSTRAATPATARVSARAATPHRQHAGGPALVLPSPTQVATPGPTVVRLAGAAADAPRGQPHTAAAPRAPPA